MNKVELKEWKSFDLVLKNFLGIIETKIFEELVKYVLIAFENLGGRACIKAHYLLFNLDWFLEDLRSLNDGE